MHDFPDPYLDYIDLRTVSQREWGHLHKQIVERAHRQRTLAIWAFCGRLFAGIARLFRIERPRTWVTRPRFGQRVL